MIADDGPFEKNPTKHITLDSPNCKPSRQTTVVAARNALVHGSSPSFALLQMEYTGLLGDSQRIIIKSRLLD